MHSIRLLVHGCVIQRGQLSIRGLDKRFIINMYEHSIINIASNNHSDIVINTIVMKWDVPETMIVVCATIIATGWQVNIPIEVHYHNRGWFFAKLGPAQNIFFVLIPPFYFSIDCQRKVLHVNRYAINPYDYCRPKKKPYYG